MISNKYFFILGFLLMVAGSVHAEQTIVVESCVNKIVLKIDDFSSVDFNIHGKEIKDEFELGKVPAKTEKLIAGNGIELSNDFGLDQTTKKCITALGGEYFLSPNAANTGYVGVNQTSDEKTHVFNFMAYEALSILLNPSLAFIDTDQVMITIVFEKQTNNEVVVKDAALIVYVRRSVEFILHPPEVFQVPLVKQLHGTLSTRYDNGHSKEYKF